MLPIDVLAILSGVLQALGYFFYLRLSLRQFIQPNPTSWVMWAYGTSLIVFLEWQTGASWRELLLPAVCAVSSVAVAAVSLREAGAILRPDRVDLIAFGCDVLLTMLFLIAWWLSRQQVIDANLLPIVAVAFIVCASLTSVTSFTPIVRSAIKTPASEHPWPWAIWTIAYLTLMIVTLMKEEPFRDAHLLVYPLLGVVMHGLMAVIALRGSGAGDQAHLYVDRTHRTGDGLFSRRSFNRGDKVFQLRGAVRRFSSRTEDDALANPNWVGIARDTWIDPDHPYDYINHSCEPNLGVRDDLAFIALREIRAGEELTFDYSTTQDEVFWRMPCNCQSASCRGMVRSIQFLPEERYRHYLPLIPMYFQSVWTSSAPSPKLHEITRP